jgi:hypothetical protein
VRNPRNILNEEFKMTVSRDFVETIKALIAKEHVKESNMLNYQYEKLAGLLDEWQAGIELDRELGVFRPESRR